MSVRGYRKGSLSANGAVASAAIGVLHLTSGVTFGVVLICFYLTSSKLTKLKQAAKSQLDAHFKVNGQRNALQGHYACCCADTWASEVGMLSPQLPRLITTWQQVPAGVNGAVSSLGMAASAGGGMLIGLVLGLTGRLSSEMPPLTLALPGLTAGQPSTSWEPDTCQQHSRSGVPLQAAWLSGGRQLLFWTVLGLCAGVAGSLVDSLLGATLQYSGYCRRTRRAVGAPGPFVTHISGRPWLSNEGVNAFSAAIAAAGTAACTWWLCSRQMI
eukprot:gene3607-3871_t